jgi:hypothetical protein
MNEYTTLGTLSLISTGVHFGNDVLVSGLAGDTVGCRRILPKSVSDTGRTVFARALDPPMHADGATATLFARALPPPMHADGATATLFARALFPPMRADAATATLFAPALLPPMRADGATATLFARALLPPMRADGATATLSARALFPPMLADAATATLFAPALPPPMRADGATATVFARALHLPMRADGATATVFALGLLPPMFTFRSLPAAPVAGRWRAALPRRSVACILVVQTWVGWCGWCGWCGLRVRSRNRLYHMHRRAFHLAVCLDTLSAQSLAFALRTLVSSWTRYSALRSTASVPPITRLCHSLESTYLGLIGGGRPKNIRKNIRNHLGFYVVRHIVTRLYFYSSARPVPGSPGWYVPVTVPLALASC